MSHTQYFYVFRDGQPADFPTQPLIQLLERHGCAVSPVDDGEFHVQLPTNDDGDLEIGFESSLFVRNGSAFDFSIQDPYYDAKFFALAADIICELGLCMFSDAGLGTYVKDASQQTHIPESISTKATVICSAKELKQALMKDD